MTNPMDDLRQASADVSGVEVLSPAAQAVLAAYYCEKPLVGSKRIAAALRAAADQVMPLTKTPWGTTLIPVLTAQESRDRLLVIAAELEGAQ